MRSTVALLLSIVVTAGGCGGKIAGDPDATRSGSAGSSSGSEASPSPFPSSSSSTTEPSPSAPPSSTSPPFGDPSKPTVEDACGVICKRDGECGAQQVDCLTHCAGEIRGAAGCSAEGNTFVQCYADNLQPGCAALPPVCENAYCAYTQCAGKVVPTYCH